MNAHRLYSVALLIAALCGGCNSPASNPEDPQQKGERRGRTETYTVDATDYTPPESPWDKLLSDDKIEDKQTAFDETVVYPITIDGYRLNLSNAVIRLDVPMLKPDQDAMLLQLHPSYQAALGVAERRSRTTGESVLPSINLIDGIAKQFDDGLYAALDQAYYTGLEKTFESHVDLVKRIHAALPGEIPATAFLAAGLSLVRQDVAGRDSAEAQGYKSEFLANPVLSKPIGVYTWNDKLGECFVFLRYFQRAFKKNDAVAVAIGKAIASDAKLRADYEAANGFYAKLTNALKRDTMLGAVESHAFNSPEVALFPASTSREGELFLRLFPLGLPPDADLMREFITRVRAGEVDLTPDPEAGWYAYQVHALETMLLPERGRESNKLLLTKGYKRRMLEAFQALMTKRRETHVRQLDMPVAAEAVPMRDLRVAPPLRLEPAATFYLRTARAYAFLAHFLESSVGVEPLKALHGLTKDGAREKDLHTELNDMRDMFYGFYLMACEDVGLKPEWKEGESVDEARARRLAGDWIAKGWKADQNLAADTRVAVPIYYDPIRNVTRLWVTLGVRLARLNTSFARGPRVKLAEGEGEWTELQSHRPQWKTHLIPVDEFAEVEVRGAKAFTRDELRALCDKHKTKAAIVKALSEL